MWRGEIIFLPVVIEFYGDVEGGIYGCCLSFSLFLIMLETGSGRVVEDMISSVTSVRGFVGIFIPSCGPGYVALRLHWLEWVVWDLGGCIFIDNKVVG